MKETEVSNFENFEGSCVRSQMIFVDGKAQEVLVRQGNAPSRVFIDQLTFVFSVECFIKLFSLDELFKDLENRDENLYYHFLIEEIFRAIKLIFGFNHYIKRDRGLNAYRHSWLIGNESANYGTICMGGNNNTCCIVLTGVGLSVALDDWEKRLYTFAKRFGSLFKLSRIDITRDFFNGEYTVDDAERDYLNDGYTLSSIRPLCDKVGYDWFNDKTKSGRTFYVGSRKNSSRMVRVYEKGKQLGDPDSNWNRVEVCYRARDLVLSIDMLLHPTSYVSEYPAIREALKQTVEIKQSKIKRKKLEITYEVASRFYSHQCGRWINFLVGIGKTADEIVAMMVKHLTIKDVPKRLDPRCYDLLPAGFY